MAANLTFEQINTLTQQIIGCAFKVSNTLGSGFLEKVYENALAYELRKAGLPVEQQFPIDVLYENINVGQYTADLLVENAILIELKAVNKLEDIHTTQCLNYIQATGYPLCLLINFYPAKIEIRRIAGKNMPRT